MMCTSVLIYFMTCLLMSYTFAQVNTIVFTESTPLPTTTATPSNTVTARQCTCVLAGTCKSSTVGIDIRIVNTGSNCTAGYVYCCLPPENLSNVICGTRKIAATVQPPGQAAYGQYPWQAALLTTSNVYIGSGVLISSNYVLTVAHKVASYTKDGFKVRLGEWDGQAITEPDPYREYKVSSITLHSNFNSQNLQNDVALIKLAETVPIANSPNINTACFPTAMPTPGTRCWVSGWGKNAFGNDGSYQSIMKEVDVPLLSQANCESSLRGTRLGQSFIFDKTSFICAGGEMGKDACTTGYFYVTNESDYVMLKGDGGSPLVCQSSTGQWEVIGMVAWGIGCANAGVPGVYVNVLNFIRWITQQMN